MLPTGVVEEGTGGSVRGSGWTVNYRFVAGAEGPELEFFASHKWTTDSLTRIRPDGVLERLGACQQFYLVGDPDAEREYVEGNRQFYEDAARRGLLDPAAGHTLINAYLRSGGSPPGESDASPYHVRATSRVRRGVVDGASPI